MKKLILLLFFFFFTFTLTGCQQTVESTDIIVYSDFKLKTADTSLGYKVFPNEISETATVNGYYFYFHPVLWVNPDIQVYLNCTYTEDEFYNEIIRLSELSASLDGYQDKNIQYTEGLFIYPAYYSIFANNKSFEYALLDNSTYTIIYVSMQYQDAGDVYFGSDFLPINYKEIYAQDKENENSFNMYVFHNEDKLVSIQ